MNERETADENAIQRAVRILGGPSAAGRALNVSHEAVRKWLLGVNAITAKRAKQIEEKTGRQVLRRELCPDFFDEAA